jgi:hypothetical protein
MHANPKGKNGLPSALQHYELNDNIFNYEDIFSARQPRPLQNYIHRPHLQHRSAPRGRPLRPQKQTVPRTQLALHYAHSRNLTRKIRLRHAFNHAQPRTPGALFNAFPAGKQSAMQA